VSGHAGQLFAVFGEVTHDRRVPHKHNCSPTHPGTQEQCETSRQSARGAQTSAFLEHAKRLSGGSLHAHVIRGVS